MAQEEVGLSFLGPRFSETRDIPRDPNAISLPAPVFDDTPPAPEVGLSFLGPRVGEPGTPETEKPKIFRIKTGQAGRGSENKLNIQARDEAPDLLAAIDAGQRDPTTLTDRQSSFVETLRLSQVPELLGSGLFEGESTKKQAIFYAILAVTPSQKEVAKIAQSLFPETTLDVRRDNIGRERFILNNPKTGVTAEINKPTLTKTDALQIAGVTAGFTPGTLAASTAARAVGGQIVAKTARELAAKQVAVKLGAQGVAAGGTQTAIEKFQSDLGGEFSKSEIALATGAGVAAEAIVPFFKVVSELVKRGFDKERAIRQTLQDFTEQTGVEFTTGETGRLSGRGDVIHLDPSVEPALPSGPVQQQETVFFDAPAFGTPQPPPRKVELTQEERIAQGIDDLEAVFTGEIQAAGATGPTEEGMQAIAKLISGRGDAQELAKAIKPQPETIAALDRLNIESTPAVISDNVEFIALHQALKAKPLSGLEAIDENTLKQLTARKDNFIKLTGGGGDPSLLDLSIKQEMEALSAGFKEKASLLYKEVNRGVPRKTRVQPSESQSYLAGRLDELQGREASLTKVERDLKKLIDESPDGVPTWAAIDDYRREVGRGFRDKGKFSDDSQRDLEAVYAAISRDQQKVANDEGVGEAYKAARAFVVEQKDMEDRAVSLFTKELDKSLVPELIGSAGELSKGITTRFDRLMKAIPEGRRQEAAATVLDLVFTKGGRNQERVSGGFVSSFTNIMKNKVARETIFNELPKKSLEIFKDFGTVAKAYFRARGFDNTSRSARAVAASLEDISMLKQLFSIGKTAAKAEIATGGQTGGVGGTIAAVGNMLKTGEPVAVASSKMMNSPDFWKVLVDSSKGLTGKEQAFQKTKVFNDWLKLATPSEQERILAGGLVQWLTGEGANDQQAEAQPEEQPVRTGSNRRGRRN